jgi:hypothetical protein
VVYELKMLEYLMYSVVVEGEQIGVVRMGKNPLEPKFSYQNEFIKGETDQIGIAVRTLLKTWKEGKAGGQLQ